MPKNPDHYISRLRLSSFRSYANAALDIEPQNDPDTSNDLGASFVVLTGSNGAGKTNLIEAISLLCPGRGLRGSPFEALSKINGEAGWAVAATIETKDGPVDVGCGLSPQSSGRRVKINGANARSVEEMAAYIRLLWLTPAMDGLFTGPAADRRRFLDRLVMTLIPDHSRSISGFEKTMRQRNRLLEENSDANWIKAVEAQMADFAAAIHFARADSIEHLQQLANISLTEAFPGSVLSLDPMFGDERDNFTSSVALETALIESWRQNRALDRVAKRTLIGPHRVDLQVFHRQKSMPAKLCSTGEQKALLIGLILAHSRLVAQMTSITPILLLDEIGAHLDPDRRLALFEALQQLNTQVWMTGTDPVLFEGLKDQALFIQVRDGTLIR